MIHYHRADGNYAGWGLHVWTGAASPTDWTHPLPPARQDAFGDVFEVPLAAGATSLSYILHNGDTKDLPDDQSLSLATYGSEVWVLGGQEGYLLPEVATSSAQLDLSTAKAQWLDASTVAVPAGYGAGDAALQGGTSAQLVYDPEEGSLWTRACSASRVTGCGSTRWPVA